MLEKKEIGTFLVLTLVLSITISALQIEVFKKVFLAVFLILALNILGKKIAAFYLDSEIEIRTWQIERYGIKSNGEFKGNFQIGIILPVVISLVSLGRLFWMASMVFDVKPKVYGTSKRHDLYSFSEMTEAHIGVIAATGVLVNLIVSVVAYFLGFPTFARLGIYFAFFSILPFSDLDGNKIFSGNIVWWSFLATLVLIGIGYAFFLV